MKKFQYYIDTFKMMIDKPPSSPVVYNAHGGKSIANHWLNSWEQKKLDQLKSSGEFTRGDKFLAFHTSFDDGGYDHYIYLKTKDELLASMKAAGPEKGAYKPTIIYEPHP
jgi:hypothetical protein